MCQAVQSMFRLKSCLAYEEHEVQSCRSEPMFEGTKHFGVCGGGREWMGKVAGDAKAKQVGLLLVQCL